MGGTRLDKLTPNMSAIVVNITIDTAPNCKFCNSIIQWGVENAGTVTLPNSGAGIVGNPGRAGTLGTPGICGGTNARDISLNVGSTVDKHDIEAISLRYIIYVANMSSFSKYAHNHSLEIFMFDIIMKRISEIITSIPFSAPTWFVLFILGFFVWLFSQASKNPKSPVLWEHMVIDASTDRASPYKLGYLVGLIVSTWLVLFLADKDKLGLDIFAAYLTYLLGGTGINVFKRDRPQPPGTTTETSLSTTTSTVTPKPTPPASDMDDDTLPEPSN
jgi:hypothetical protein